LQIKFGRELGIFFLTINPYFLMFGKQIDEERRPRAMGKYSDTNIAARNSGDLGVRDKVCSSFKKLEKRWQHGNQPNS